MPSIQAPVFNMAVRFMWIFMFSSIDKGCIVLTSCQCQREKHAGFIPACSDLEQKGRGLWRGLQAVNDECHKGTRNFICHLSKLSSSSNTGFTYSYSCTTISSIVSLQTECRFHWSRQECFWWLYGMLYSSPKRVLVRCEDIIRTGFMNKLIFLSAW